MHIYQHYDIYLKQFVLPSSSIRFRLEAQFGSRIPLLDGAQLQALQAQGMAYRLAVIEQLGVLP